MYRAIRSFLDESVQLSSFLGSKCATVVIFRSFFFLSSPSSSSVILPLAVWLKKACPMFHHFNQTSVVGESGNGRIQESESETETLMFVLTEAIAQLTNESETEQLMLVLTKESAQSITAVVIIRNNVW